MHRGLSLQSGGVRISQAFAQIKKCTIEGMNAAPFWITCWEGKPGVKCLGVTVVAIFLGERTSWFIVGQDGYPSNS